ncbi:MAG: FkbM family methyltransferase [Pyrinomonadaceae bacterium]
MYRYKGLDILVDHAGGDANGAREVLTSPMYSRFFERMQLEGPLNILDLGASNGGFPLLLAASGLRLDRVVSVEFNPRTFTRLHFNLTRNLDCVVIPVNAALCGKSRSLRVTVGTGGVSDSIYNSSEGNDVREYEIEGVSFDDLFQRYFEKKIVDICKIDVEGAEFEVFENTNYQSLKNCRYLIMEIHERNGRRADEILPVVKAAGFERQPNEADADQSVHFFVNTILADQ